ncbi:HD domain-containing protein [Candidatus Gracilibacteria bacterium]|nr:HD domain-containing protein [Candidatus Gracilibacteria bacterium]
MKTTITRTEARELLNKYLKTPYLRDHSRESEVVLAALAERLGENKELWGATGLIHDLDMDIVTAEDNGMENHSKKTIEILQEEGYDIPEAFQAIRAHTEGCLKSADVPRSTKFDYALAAGETVTGLITAYVRMRPERFEGASVKSLTKKFKDKAFAANVSREFINDIGKVGLERGEFFQIALDAMAEIADEIEAFK